MKGNQAVSRGSLFVYTALACAVLSACGGEVSQTANAQSTDSLSGTAATGAAIVGAPVSAQCVDGRSDGLTGASGQFELALVGSTPCVLSVVSNGNVLYSVANNSGPVNVTPLTTLVVEYLRAFSQQGSGTSAEVLVQSAEFKAAVASAGSLAEAVSEVRNLLLENYGIDVGMDFMSEEILTPESGNQNDADRRLDQMRAAGASDDNGRPKETDRQAMSQRGSQARANKVPTNPSNEAPTDAPTGVPTDAPTDVPTEAPNEAPTDAPSAAPSGSIIPGLNLGGISALAPLQPLVALGETVGLMPAPAPTPAPAPEQAPTSNPGNDNMASTPVGGDSPANGFDAFPVSEPAPAEPAPQQPLSSGKPDEATTNTPASESQELPVDEPIPEPTEAPYAVQPDNAGEAPVEEPDSEPKQLPPDTPTSSPVQAPPPEATVSTAGAECYSPWVRAIGAAPVLSYLGQHLKAIPALSFVACDLPAQPELKNAAN